MKVNRTRIGCAVVAILAAMTVLLTTGCPLTGFSFPQPEDPVMMVEVFNLDDWLDGRRGTLTDDDLGDTFETAGATVAGVAAGLRLHEIQAWGGGIDFFGYNGFAAGDIVRITATGDMEAGQQLVLQVATGGDFDTVQRIGGAIQFNDGTATATVPLTAEIVSRIYDENDPHGLVGAIRIRLNNPNTGDFVITSLILERNMAAPNVAIGGQVGNVVSGEAGAESYRTVTFPIAASFLHMREDGLPGGVTLPQTINFGTPNVVTGLPAGVTASGTITINEGGSGNVEGSGTGTLTLIVAADANLDVGTHPFTVTLLGTESAPSSGNLFISGLTVEPEIIVLLDDAAYTPFRVTAFRLATGGANSVSLFVDGVPAGVTLANPGIVVDANGSGSAILAIAGADNSLELTIAAPGTRASTSVDVILPLPTEIVPITNALVSRANANVSVSDEPGGGLRVDVDSAADGVVDFAFGQAAFPDNWRHYAFGYVTLVLNNVVNHTDNPVILRIASGHGPGARFIRDETVPTGSSLITIPGREFISYTGTGPGLTILANQPGRSINFGFTLYQVVFHFDEFTLDPYDIETIESISVFDGLQGAGAPPTTFALATYDGDFVELRVSGRAADWHGLDLMFAQITALSADGTYNVRMTGRGLTVPAGSQIMLQGLPGHNWGTLVDLAAGEDFTITRSQTMGGDFETFRITTNVAGATASFAIRSLEILSGDNVIWSMADVLMD